jgi:hypothetical protein
MVCQQVPAGWLEVGFLDHGWIHTCMLGSHSDQGMVS